MKRKIGDKVKIKKDLVAGEAYGGVSFYENMTQFLGCEVEINYVDEVGEYMVNENVYWWSEEMLEDIGQPEKIKESNIECLLKQLLDEDLLTLKGRELVKDYFNN